MSDATPEIGSASAEPEPDPADLAERIRESLDANNAWEWYDEVNGVQTGFDGNKDVLAEAIAADLLATPDRARPE